MEFEDAERVKIARMMRQFVFLGIASAFLAVGLVSRAEGGSPPATSYKKDVAPIMRQYCIACHSKTNATEELDLSSYAAIMKGGEHGKVVKVKKSAESKLVRAMKGQSGVDKMPPGDVKVPAEKIAKVAKWIDEGAKNN